MKIITVFLLFTASMSLVHAKVYKCPGKMQGHFVYQQMPCKGAKSDEHTVKIVPFDQQKIDAAQQNLAREMDALKNKETPSVESVVNTEINPAILPTVPAKTPAPPISATNTKPLPAAGAVPPAPLVPVKSAESPAGYGTGNNP